MKKRKRSGGDNEDLIGMIKDIFGNAEQKLDDEIKNASAQDRFSAIGR